MDTEKSDKRAQRFFRRLRLTFLIVFLMLSTALGILHQYSQATKPVGVDALDPFGGIESAITLIVSGKMLAKIAWSSFILLFATLIAALLFRRVFCGKICAFGALQELFGKLGKAIFKRRLEAPRAIDKPARFLKYLVLAAVVTLSAATAELFIRPYDPWAAYHHLLSSELISGFLVGLILLGVSLAGSLLYDRFFCKYLCPMGGFLGLINRLGWFRVKSNEATCTHCYACDKACPVKNTLIVGGPKKGAISSFAVLGITLGIYFAVLGISTATGGFEWTVKPLGQTVKESRGFDTEQIKDAAHKEGSGFDTEAVRDFVREKLGK